MKQRIVWSVIWILEKALTKFIYFKAVYGNEFSQRPQVFEGFKHFRDGREDVENDTCPSTSEMDETLKKSLIWSYLTID